MTQRELDEIKLMLLERKSMLRQEISEDIEKDARRLIASAAKFVPACLRRVSLRSAGEYIPGVLTKRKEHTESEKEITIVGVVREIEDDRKPYRVGILAGTEIFAVRPKAEGQNLLYEVGNKVEATGRVSTTKDGRLRIDVSGYEVYEMTDDDPEEFDYGL
jgi:hypothetical protein